MSVTFYGRKGGDSQDAAIMLDYEHPHHLNLHNGGAAAFLAWLGLPCEYGSGDCTVAEARRAIMRARNTDRAGAFTREGSDTKRPGRVRVIDGGIGEDYLLTRLDRFEAFLNHVVEQGAVSIYWG